MRQGLSTSPRFSLNLNVPVPNRPVASPSPPRPRRRAAGLGSGGCSSTQKPDLTVTSLQSGQRYSQQFDEATCSRDRHGDTDVVLAADADHPGGQPGVLKQVMHIRVMWHSDRDTQWEGAADTNASIRWYVFTDRTGQPEMIEYAGTGLVVVKARRGADVGHRAQRLAAPGVQPRRLERPDRAEPLSRDASSTRADRQRGGSTAIGSADDAGRHQPAAGAGRGEDG